jgi:hypothetical protein
VTNQRLPHSFKEGFVTFDRLVTISLKETIKKLINFQVKPMRFLVFYSMVEECVSTVRDMRAGGI